MATPEDDRRSPPPYRWCPPTPRRRRAPLLRRVAAAGCCDCPMEPASIAARPATHRGRRRALAGHRPPRRARGSIARPRLLNRLSEARDAPLVLLVAPAGYGKTTLFSEWAARDARRFAWFDAGPRRRRSGAAARVGQANAPRRGAADGLIVDNAHIIADDEAFEALEEAVRSMPPGSQLALASRCEPALPVGSLRAQRRVLELASRRSGHDTQGGASALLTNAGITCESDGLDTVMRRTEGWPVGVYLAALSLAAQANVDTALSRFAGDDRVVADYLQDEVLSRLDPDRLAFLLHTSILGTLSGSALRRGDRRERLGERCSTLSLVRTSCSFLDGPRRHGLPVPPALRRDAPRRAAPRSSRSTRLGSTLVRARGTRSTATSSRPSTTRSPPATRSWPERSCAAMRARTSATGTSRRCATGSRDFSEDQVAAVPALALAAANAHLAAGEGDRARHWTAAAAGPATPPRAPHRRRAAACGARREQHGSDGTRRGTRGSARGGGR